jgi:DNA polymerase-3 subunit epsilon
MKNHQKPKLKDKVILWARDVLDHKDRYVILDTETTGLNKNDVLIQIAIIDLDGNELLNSLVKPTKRKRMSAESTAIHGLTMRDLANAPTFEVLRPEIDRIVAGRIVLIYNAEFDARLIRQTTMQDECSLPRLRATCVMQHYSWFVQEWSDYHNDWKYQKLPSAEHSAVGDCRATLKVLQQMAMAELSKMKKPQINVPQTIDGIEAKKWWQFWK